MKKFSTEMIVGLFVFVGCMGFVYLSTQMGEFSFFSLKNNYRVESEFDNVTGLKVGAGIEIAGVNIGKVSAITLGEEGLAKVMMLVKKEIKLTSDAIASVRTQGLIGDKYIKITQGADEEMLEDGGVIFETESSIDIEELVSKYIFESD